MKPGSPCADSDSLEARGGAGGDEPTSSEEEPEEEVEEEVEEEEVEEEDEEEDDKRAQDEEETEEDERKEEFDAGREYPYFHFSETSTQAPPFFSSSSRFLQRTTSFDATDFAPLYDEMGVHRAVRDEYRLGDTLFLKTVARGCYVGGYRRPIDLCSYLAIIACF